MSRVDALLQWARRVGARVSWLAPYTDQYSVTVEVDDLWVLATGRDSGQAAGNALDVIGVRWMI